MVLFVGDSDSILDEEVDMGVAVVEEDSSYWVGTEVGCKHCMVGNCILWDSVGCIGVGVIVGKWFVWSGLVWKMRFLPCADRVGEKV
jgi:hypothetical protein